MKFSGAEKMAGCEGGHTPWGKLMVSDFRVCFDDSPLSS